MNRIAFLCGLVILAFLAGLSLAGIPKMINYQGMLTQPDGVTPVSNGNYPILFRIYNLSSGGTLKWSHTYNLTVTNGLFNVILGDSGAPIDLPFDEDYWLEITVNGSILSPRIRLTSVGYAYRALRSDSAGYAFALVDGNYWGFRITDTADTTLITGGRWGIARSDNTLYGNADSTHVNLGVACTTGTSGQNYKYCTVGGGVYNTTRGEQVTVGGGGVNTASGYAATVPGGYADTAAGDYSFAAGDSVRATSTADYTFAFGRNFTTSTPNAVIFHNSVDPIKVGIGTTSPTSKLHLSGSEATVHGKDACITLQNTASGGAKWYLRAGATGTQEPLLADFPLRMTWTIE